MKKKNIILLSLGSNLGDRLQNLRDAVQKLSSVFSLKKMSHVIETEAILPKNAPADWNIPYLNMVLAANANCSPSNALSFLKEIEAQLGRDINAPTWSPRVIDIDILKYGDYEINSDQLIIPHRELSNRVFLRFLLDEIGYLSEDERTVASESYTALNHFVLYPKFVGILNVTPDSFSDGGKFMEPEKAEQHARALLRDGAAVLDIGAQSTRPGYAEIPPSEEISRLSEVLERCSDIDNISIDTYFDDVVKYVLKRPNVKWINDQNSILAPSTIKLIANRGVKLVIMLQGNNWYWLADRVAYLRKLGIKKSNIIVDPGIGFGKTKHENVRILKNIDWFRNIGCEILLGASRKSFLGAHSNAAVEDRDLETIAVSSFAAEVGIHYLRVHNLKDHMRFFVTRHCIENA